MNPSETSPDAGPSFADMGLPEPLCKAIKERGYAAPTPVQAAVYNPATEGRDCVVQARTGTGKTAAFGMPLIGSRVRPRKQHCQALILCPTRELALQITKELQALAQYSELNVVSVYGGAPMQPQIDALANSPHIVVGTPGRVLDHLKRQTLHVQDLRAFVLDECDEMLSMGFLPQIDDVWQQLPQGHQTLLFSATLPKEVSRIAETRLRQPEFITLSGDHIGALSIQHFVYISHGNKVGDLLQIIDVEDPESAIVFCNTKDETKRVAKALQERGFAADWLNADLGQSDRERVMRATQESRLRFLVCTDVAARGIDISHLTHVINFDFPDSSEQYVHRTGRTGRAGRMGTAISLVSPTAIGDLYYLRLKYKIHPVERSLPTQQERQTREEADVVASVSLKYAAPNPEHSYRAVARRLLTHDEAESIIAGLLEAVLGTHVNATETATQERVGRSPGPLARPRSPRSSSASLTSDRTPRDARRDRSNNSQPQSPPRRRMRDASEYVDADSGIKYEVSSAGDAGDGIPTQEPNAVSSPIAVDDAQTIGTTPTSPEGTFVNLYLNVGKRDGANLEHVVQALAAAGIDSAHTGAVTVKARHSYVQVAPTVQELALARLNGMDICGRSAHAEVARPRSGD
jgi:ATP-dependent RNA helicase DeaD